MIMMVIKDLLHLNANVGALHIAGIAAKIAKIVQIVSAKNV